MVKNIKCLVCGKEFEVEEYTIVYSTGRKNTRFPIQKYCSSKCGSSANYKKHRDYYKNYWLTRPNLWAWKEPRICEVCEINYEPKSPKSKTCSRKCSKRRWKLLNPEVNRKINNASAARSRKKDPERYRFYVKNRKHMIRESRGSSKNFSKTFTLKDWDEIKKKAEYKCLICGLEVKLTIDHTVPLSKGGAHSKENIQPLCHSCNSRKRDKLVPSTV